MDNFGDTISLKISRDGSKPIISPFVKLFTNTLDSTDLRSATRKENPMLIADIAHYLCVAHGRHPGIIEHAASKIIDETSREWLLKAADGFARERIFLAELTVAAGPITRIVGQDETDMLIVNQAKQYHMLASSDRKGCPLGAAASFILDWYNIRQLLDIITLQLSMSAPEMKLPTITDTIQLLDEYANSDSIVRAITFGSDQILSQQRAFWNIIQSRSTSRNL